MHHILRMASDGNQVAENLVRHANGTSYLRAKVHGKLTFSHAKKRGVTWLVK
jgi:hypothetical protein